VIAIRLVTTFLSRFQILIIQHIISVIKRKEKRNILHIILNICTSAVPQS